MKKENSNFWTEQHSWGDFPFDKPYINLSQMSFRKGHIKKNLFLEKLGGFVKEMFVWKTSDTMIRYPLI